MDKSKLFESEEALSARVRELTAEVSKLRHELETTLQQGRKPGPGSVVVNGARLSNELKK